MERIDDFLKQLRANAMEISPDFPNIDTCDEWDQLLAIKSAYLGTHAACEDLHDIIEILRERMGMTKEQIYDLGKEIMETKPRKGLISCRAI